MERFSTASGSTYEVDLAAQRIRRVGNSAGLPPTPRQGADGQWRHFHALALAWFAGEVASVVIYWDGHGAFTATSDVRLMSSHLSHLLGRGDGPDARKPPQQPGAGGDLEATPRRPGRLTRGAAQLTRRPKH